MNEEEIVQIILRKLVYLGKWGGSHTSIDNVIKICRKRPTPHFSAGLDRALPPWQIFRTPEKNLGLKAEAFFSACTKRLSQRDTGKSERGRPGVDQERLAVIEAHLLRS